MADEFSPLEREIRRLIGVAGPMPIAQYMRLCLTHPQHGYYINRDPLGAGGDFVTSPEISQMFGELIGLWMAAVWRQMGGPEDIRIIELGPGRGTLMHDALRAAKVVDGFRSAIVVHLVEISPALQQIQERRLADLDVPVLWHTTLDEVPAGASIVIANEFVDALPVHQAVKQDDGWHERAVGYRAGRPPHHRPQRAIRCRISKPRCRAACAKRPLARSTNGARTISRLNWDGACATKARP